jgi:CopG family nickel-responsive transcriptional regulator
MTGARNGNSVERISMSLPGAILCRLDEMVTARGYESRSQAITDMIVGGLSDWEQERGEEVMAGTITLVYDRNVPGLQSRLADLQHAHIDEVISSLHVQLEHGRTMEVILVQGPARQLQAIMDAMVTARGVITGNMQLTASIIPPLHPLRMQAEDQAENTKERA